MAVSINEFVTIIERLQGFAQQNVQDRLLIVQAKVVEAAIKVRVFENGLDAKDSIIADGYSTKPFSFTRDQFAQKSKFKANTTRKGKPAMFLKRGYKELREIQGRPVDRPDAEYTGSLKTSIQSGKSGQKTVIGIVSRLEKRKRNNLEGPVWGKPIFTPSPKDLEEGKKALETEIEAIIQEII